MRVLLGLLATGVALSMPAAAQAGAKVELATVNGVDIAHITSNAGGSNLRVSFRASGCGGTIAGACDEFYANSGGVTNGSGCDQQGFDLVRCPHRTAYVAELGDGRDSLAFDNIGYDAVVASGGGGDDSLQGATSCAPTEACETLMNGDAGNDVLIGGPGPDELHGGDGSDELHGSAGNDKLFGEGGNDLVLEGQDGNDLVDGGDGDDLLGGSSSAGGPELGADTWVGGAGSDTLSFDQHAGGANISLDGQPNDGSPGEGDNVGGDIERIIGTRGADTFTGSPQADRFDGGPGNDTISGGEGGDTLNGDTGNDTVNGGGGADTAAGGDGDDTVDGGPGGDTLLGDTANCSVLSCPAGNDTIRARDGERDVIGCGLLFDTVIADAIDLTDGECESVDRPAVTTAPTTPSTDTPAALRGTTLSRSKLKATKKGVVTITVSNPNAYTVIVAVTLKQGKRTAGSGGGSLGPSQTGIATVKLSKAALKSLKKKKRLSLQLTLRTTGPNGTTPATATQKVTVK